MRISLSAAHVAAGDSLRAYVEYRLFTSIARHHAIVSGADVLFRQATTRHARFVCTIALDLGAAGRVKTQARGTHPEAAIDRAAERAAWLLERRVRSAAFQAETASFTS
jgi:ribosome-associated translation inhibitor RaiA